MESVGRKDTHKNSSIPPIVPLTSLRRPPDYLPRLPLHGPLSVHSVAIMPEKKGIPHSPNHRIPLPSKDYSEYGPLQRSPGSLYFRVCDSGIGIPDGMRGGDSRAFGGDGGRSEGIGLGSLGRGGVRGANLS
jgi:hypothetical protein